MTETAASRPEPDARRFGGLAVYGERRTFTMLLLGFASGLPNLLIFDTLSAWLRDDGVSLEVIGFFALATLTYALKFVWAPLLDRTNVPILTKWLGHRRSWMLLTQAMIIVGLWAMSTLTPQTQLAGIAFFAVAVGFFGATQDIAIDAWRIEAADDTRQGAMAAAYQLGWRVAQIAAGFIPLALAQYYNWNLSYAVMAGLMTFGVLGVMMAPREKKHIIRPIPVEDIPSRPVFEKIEWVVRLGLIIFAAFVIGTGLTDKPDALLWGGGLVLSEGARAAITATVEQGGLVGVLNQLGYVIGGFGLLAVACWPIPRFKTRPGAYLAGSFGAPLMDFFVRFGKLAGPILALICLYRLADFVLNIMNPFYIDLGFSLIEIGEVRKLFGVIALSAGVFAGGWAVARFGLIRTMVIGAFMSPVSNLVFAWLAAQGHDLGALFIAIGVDNVASGFAGTALIAYMSSLTSIGFTATQYALFSSLYALPGKIIASQSGKIVEASARAADAGGPLSGLKGLFANVPPGTLVEGAVKSGVTPAGLGAGYVTFFLYSTVIGVFAVLLAFYVAARQPRVEADYAAREQEQTP
ncbi:AmpG family muropeptide MFS transporter [Brevundimonas halotolerans]|uniref:PAT family beta-lactamase induction signal transducer AmpG n=1 Tax=Brevundimonas halotolerans TaxID=69670 RepID=A0A7W9A4Y3_9CAUL|nr:MFS transporter [Brevundimonas halotolerans]MBB5661527.1 PAT family beta-lactamase induction signal transducer AmpG [Brevundimonas halotolerans]